ncbi:hypothetical protein MBLNU459_g0786t1 [Dothideomycetes sp. NU459]
MPQLDFDPEKMPDLSGKVVLVTGATSGLGRETLFYLSTHSPKRIIFTGRNETVAQEIVSGLESRDAAMKGKVAFVQCDLSNLASVKEASKAILAQIDRLDIFMCVAGIMGTHPSLSTDGYEIQFATNHVGHALMTKLLLPTLLSTAEDRTADVRIVITTSTAAGPTTLPSGSIQFDKLKTTQSMPMGPMRRYGQSKLANLYYARALARRYPQIMTTSVHPGLGYTGLQNSLGLVDRFMVRVTTFWKLLDAKQLAWSGLWAATVDKSKLENGAYYEPVGKKIDFKDVRGDMELEKKLWEWTEKELDGWNV